MTIIQTGVFSFNYTALDQATGLFVAFSIYDVTSGTPIFQTQLAATYSNFGVYTGTFRAQPGRSYLILGACYTDGTFTTVDTTRAPSSEIYQASGANLTLFTIAYSFFDFSSAAFVRSMVFDNTTGTPTPIESVNLTYVALGTYFGNFTATLNHTYEIASVVYTDGTYSTVDIDYAPSCDDFSAFILPGPIEFIDAYSLETDGAVFEPEIQNGEPTGNVALVLAID